MNKFKLFLCLIHLAIGIKLSKSQEPYIYQFGEEKGLPSMEVYDIAQDKNGIIWIGTDQGLFRYNGMYFKKFSNSKQLGKSILKIRIDPFNKVWCSNYNNQLFYVQGDSINLLEIKLSKPIPSVLFGWHILNNKIYLFRSYEHIIEIDLKNLKQKLIDYRPKIFDYWPTKKSVLMVELKNNGVFFKDSGQFYSKQFKLPDKSPNIIENNGDSIILISRTETNITQYNPKYGYTDHPLQKIVRGKTSGVLNIMVEDNNYWILTFNGVFWAKKVNGAFVLVSHFLKDKKIANALKDREGNYWFTSTGNGLFVMPNKNVWIDRQNFDSPVNYTSKPCLINDSILVYIQNNQTIVYLNTRQKKIINEIKLPYSYDVEAITQYDKDHLLISQYNVYLYNLAKNKIEFNFLFKNAKDIKLMSKDAFVFNSASGIGICELNQKTWTPFRGFNPQYAYFHEANTRYFKSRRSRCVGYNNSTNLLYIGYIEGLHYVTPNSEGIINNKVNKPIQANSISIDKNKRVWVCSSNNGIIVIKDTTIVKIFYPPGFEKDYSFNNGTIDAEENFWFTCSGNIFGYNSNYEQIFHANLLDGLAGNQINGLAVDTNSIYITTNKGLSIIDKKMNFKNLVEPKIFIDDKKVNGNVVENFEGLDYNENNLSVSIYSNMYKARGNFKYLKRLLPDTQWVEFPAAESNIYLSSLSPGNYQLQIFAENEDQTKSPLKTISIKILKPIWQQAWFIFIAFILFGLSIAFAFKKRINRINREANLKQEKSRLEIEKLKLEDSLRSSTLSALKAQMNPHFIFNALNSIQDYILLNEKNLATSYLGKFSDLIRLYLDMSNEDMVSLSKEIKALELYIELENLRFENSISVTIKVDETIDPDLIKIPALLIQPYVENAFKHGLFHKKENKKLNINFTYLLQNPKILEVIIQDNGVGMEYTQQLLDKSKRHKSFATKANKERLDILNKRLNTNISVEFIDLKNENNEPEGTQVKLYIPLLC